MVVLAWELSRHGPNLLTKSRARVLRTKQSGEVRLKICLPADHWWCTCTVQDFLPADSLDNFGRRNCHRNLLPTKSKCWLFQLLKQWRPCQRSPICLYFIIHHVAVMRKLMELEEFLSSGRSYPRPLPRYVTGLWLLSLRFTGDMCNQNAGQGFPSWLHAPISESQRWRQRDDDSPMALLEGILAHALEARTIV